MTAPARRMIGPDGVSYDVPPEQAQQAVDAGMRDETPADVAAAREKEQYGGIKGGAESAAAGALESIPFVGGALSKALVPDSKTANKYHYFTHGAGELGGMVAQTAATGGLGEALGLGGDALEGASMLSRSATRAAVGAAEGGLIYGPGYAVNDSVLNDHPLTAEYLLAASAGGALLGGTLAGGLSIGGDLASEGLEKIGNAARRATLAKLVGADTAALEEAGLTTSRINDLFRDGLIKSGDTPIQIQTRLAERLGQIGNDLGDVGQTIDASGQTFNLPNILGGAGLEAPEKFSNMLQPGEGLGIGDEAAPFARAAQLRQALQQQTSEDAAKLSKAIDDAIVSKAGAIEPGLGEQASSLLKEHAAMSELSRMADDAVAGGKEAIAGPSQKGGVFGALMRQGEHVATWGMLGRFAGSAMGGHVGLGMFVGASAGNVLHAIMDNPAAIAEKFGIAQGAIANTVGMTGSLVDQAVAAAIREAGANAGKVGGGISPQIAALMLPSKATASDVAALHQRYQELAPPVRNGNPHINNAVQRQRGVIAQALPPVPGAPLPMSLARRADPGPKQIAIYNDTVKAIANPIGTIAGIGNGSATHTQIAAIRAAYPALASRVAAALVNRSAESGKTAHFALRRAIGALTGKPVDPALDPAKIARIQMTFQPPQMPGRAGAAPGGQSVKISQKGLDKLDVAGRMNALSQPAGKE